MTPSEQNQQLLIDLANAHKENQELRKSVNSLSKVTSTTGAFVFGMFIGGILSGPVWLLLQTVIK